ncbi:ShlB/FhaC/HecB family hemolysin secretion/activation protein [Pseudomonas peradeniyensis]|uniref:ShlB/FhaC/HecB family hemolysin secretion/activation protein n=1 Tax=Pseudomonas peradeniyensis TaxID=2745488 RepID=A0ABT2VFL3_9PSED|nr:ShlB/FhaC/HecB family hemolysin secretion/activation protein [Pseudomonas peradeniyensis]MCU7240527.1 ShlB/FhaC/HecB family hemolysin secretion/activation protein [Pseudomonas peradeniyensis]
MPMTTQRLHSLTIARCISQLLLAILATAIPLAQADPASQQLRNEQQKLRQLEQQQRLDRWQRPQPSTALEATDSTFTASDQHCWAISGVRLAGNRTLDTRQLESTVRAVSSSCMGIAEIDRLLKHLTQHYVEAGYPTSRPYVTRPPEHGAPLEIVIVEGFIESIELAGANLPLSLRGAFPGQLGQPLHLPDLEQGLDQLNRLRAYDLEMALLPGELRGGTRVVIEPRRVASPVHLNALLDNRGGELTGRHRLNLGLGLDSPLGLNDDLRLSLSSVVFGAPGQSEGSSLYYSLPHGRWTFTLNASRMRYRAPIPNTRHASSGRSEFFGLGAERVLWRNHQGMLSASARLDRKQLVNRFGPAVLALQSPTLATVEAGLNLLWLEGGLWNAYLGLSQGMHWLGADRPFAHKQAPRPDFTRYRANLLHLRQGPAQWPWRWQSELALQYSAHVLPAVEQMSLSDHSAVRGFRQHNVSGASAGAWRNTLSQPLPLPVQVRPTVGLDLGWARYARSSPSQRLVGASAGVELSLPRSQLRLDYQRGLYASDRPRKTLEQGFWVAQWSLNI